jgi:hypothetical protein
VIYGSTLQVAISQVRVVAKVFPTEDYYVGLFT